MFSHAHWLFMYLPWRKVYSNPLPVFHLSYFWVVKGLLYTRPFSDTWFADILSQYCGLSFNIVDTIWNTKVLNFSTVYLLVFCCLCWDFFVVVVWDRALLCHLGWSAVVQSWLTATSASQTQVILTPQPLKMLGLQE